MKLRRLLFIAALSVISNIYVVPSSQASVTCAQGGVCQLGDTGPGGGKVFFVKSTGSFTKSRTEGSGMFSQTYSLSLTADQQAALTFDYLEVAPTQSSSIRWGSNGAISGGTSTLIGKGASNTANIISTFPADTASNNAAFFAETYVNNGKSDWFLPSYDELLLISILSLESDSGGPNIGSFPDGYWASTSSDNSNARYSARTQLSGYVVKASSANAIAIRSFSRTVFETTNNDEFIRQENERKRQEAIRAAQDELVRKVKAHIEVLKSDLAAAETALIEQPLLEKANIDFKNLDTATIINFPRVNFIISKYEVYARISGNISGAIYPRDLVKYGLLDESTPLKCVILSDIKARATSERDTLEEINQLIATARSQQLARKEHLAATIARIHSR